MSELILTEEQKAKQREWDRHEQERREEGDRERVAELSQGNRADRRRQKALARKPKP